MNIRSLTNSDRDSIQGFLQQQIESSVFLYSNLQQSSVVDGDQPYQGFYVGLFTEQQLTGVASHNWNGIILLQAPIHTKELVAILARKTKRPIKGILGPWSQVLLAKQALQIPEEEISYCNRELLFHLNIDDMCLPSIRADQRLRSRLAPLTICPSCFYGV